MDVGPLELLIVLVVVLLLFGGAKIPQIARSLGRAQKEFKAGLHDDQHEPDPADPDDTRT